MVFFWKLKVKRLNMHIHRLIQQLNIDEYLLRARHCPKYLEYMRGQNKNNYKGDWTLLDKVVKVVLDREWGLSEDLKAVKDLALWLFGRREFSEVRVNSITVIMRGHFALIFKEQGGGK